MKSYTSEATNYYDPSAYRNSISHLYYGSLTNFQNPNYVAYPEQVYPNYNFNPNANIYYAQNSV